MWENFYGNSHIPGNLVSIKAFCWNLDQKTFYGGILAERRMITIIPTVGLIFFFADMSVCD